VLMDRKLPLEIDDKVAEIVARYRNEGVHGFHDLRTRRSGSEKFIDFHLEVDRNKRFEEAHDLTVKILRAIEAEIPRSKVHVHTIQLDEDCLTMAANFSPGRWQKLATRIIQKLIFWSFCARHIL